MKPTLEQEYYAIYVRSPHPMSRAQMVDGIRYHRRISSSGRFIDPAWLPRPYGRGNRATRRFAAIVNARRTPHERKYNWFGPISWHAGNRLGLCCSIDDACHLIR